MLEKLHRYLFSSIFRLLAFVNTLRSGGIGRPPASRRQLKKKNWGQRPSNLSHGHRYTTLQSPTNFVFAPSNPTCRIIKFPQPGPMVTDIM
ncbi:hypothetical protein BDZ94DRAFT_1264713 [Collybia nuda]|uniref:Uncharacterized protein n=1 Tax=Collybia nuda TaxID=64659 RepID=A0A9P5Y3V3_9AGAR|nr:hypothetical protein BDZ94DRAFT_1264713 [Collybia nuda]